MMLDSARTGQPMTVVGRSRSSSAISRRLAELGIRPGATLQIQSRTSGGGAILAIGDDRIAVSRQILDSIEVDPEVLAHG
jgi:ferrous iron transport protein A